MASKDYFAESHGFAGKSLSSEQIQRLFLTFIDRQIGTKSDFEDPPEDANKWMLGFISKEYGEGLACAVMTFELDRTLVMSRAYFNVTLSAETPYEKRRDLTRRLYEEVGTSIDDYFNKPVV
jgi:hypothetical protein